MHFSIKRISFLIFFSLLLFLIILYIFFPLLKADCVIIPYSIKPFDICKKAPELWNLIKSFYIIFCFFACLILSNSIFSKFFNKNIKRRSTKASNLNKNELNLFVGKNAISKENVFIPEKGLFQNILITGTIGSGKTSSFMYPATKQLIEYESNNSEKKLGLLILDVKGNYYKQVKEYAKGSRKAR